MGFAVFSCDDSIKFHFDAFLRDVASWRIEMAPDPWLLLFPGLTSRSTRTQPCAAASMSETVGSRLGRLTLFVRRPMDRELAQKIWFSFICRFLLWFSISEILSGVCFFVLAMDPHHPSRFLVVLSWIATVVIFGFTSYVSLKAALKIHLKAGAGDA